MKIMKCLPRELSIHVPAVGAISKAQKAQKTFFEKKLEIFEFLL